MHNVAPANLLLHIHTEPVDVIVTLQICIWEVTDSNPRQDSGNPD
jgi:hypothetical protein